MPAACLNISPAKWVPLPLPAEARLSMPGLDLAIAMSSCVLFAPSAGGTTSTYAVLYDIEMPAKSLRVSYGSLRTEWPMACAADIESSV